MIKSSQILKEANNELEKDMDHFNRIWIYFYDRSVPLLDEGLPQQTDRVC